MHPTSGANVLVIEDNRILATLLTRMLEAEGHLVKSVHDGRAGLKAALQEDPDLVLLDIGRRSSFSPREVPWATGSPGSKPAPTTISRSHSTTTS
jgi:DNA-binding NarL/FixJ family response regulator